MPKCRDIFSGILDPKFRGEFPGSHTCFFAQKNTLFEDLFGAIAVYIFVRGGYLPFKVDFDGKYALVLRKLTVNNY